MINTSFVKRRLVISITLGKGAFGAVPDVLNTKIIDGLRVECDITKGGHPSKNGAKLKIYGMLEADMNSLTSMVFSPMAIRKNLIKVQAGDDSMTIANMPVAFQGDITGAWAVYHSPPNLYFHIEALSGFYPSAAPVKPISLPGSASVPVVMAGLAKSMGYSFENNGVVSQIANPYLQGAPLRQAETLADAADIEFGVDDETLFIAPRGSARMGTVPLISAETGMKDYPIFDKKGLSVECLYNPSIKLGGLIAVVSRVSAATATWRVTGLTHHLSCEHPGGHWLSRVKATRIGS